MSGAGLYHFYHIYADGEWREPVEEHLHALQTSGLAAEEDFSLRVGLVGNERNSAAVREFLNGHSIEWSEIASSPEGWEQVTLNALAQASRDVEGFVLYAHTKGAALPSRFNTEWRRRRGECTRAGRPRAGSVCSRARLTALRPLTQQGHFLAKSVLSRREACR